MYCPKCNAEYREGFVECNTCSIPLIDGPQAQPDSDEGEWVSKTVPESNGQERKGITGGPLQSSRSP